ncbi:helix-turn-helix domain-containing protein [Cohnella fermenti]|uniref:Helix-turn-helix domain-containing protein n=1 Tax=Cohnella fermenti TaxID=2565925 RepID=A0A4S4BU29_9BACL|nr:helix-turn-helix domain-containing protein [Cohnella fermenti]THF78439.1 helix-turn-helix domain-containing protein [Cohnella fermenti]
MSDLGLLLRKAREQRGYTLDDIQEATKIRKRYLEAIENGEYKVLPGSFYVRAFVKTYAETVGLDAEEVLRLYHKELPKPTTAETVAPEAMLKPKSRSVQHNDKWGKLAVNLLMWLFPLLIIALIYYFIDQNSASKAKNSDRDTDITHETTLPSPSSSPDGSSTPSQTSSEEPTPSETVPATTLTLTETTKGGEVHYEVSPAGAHELKIVSSGSWVGVNETNKNGKSRYQGTPKEEIVFSLEDMPLYVNVGQANNVVITIDGIAVDDGDKAGSKKFVFTPAASADTTTP